jgi:hypothetical protein
MNFNHIAYASFSPHIGHFRGQPALALSGLVVAEADVAFGKVQLAP